jgi:G3E family GTPase
MEASLNLSRTFEAQLLALRTGSSRCVPAVLVCGALGAGKTSLVRSLLRERGNLRFAVLVNELAAADIDSALLGAAGANAASGLPLLSLPDGCACCAGLAALRSAVRQVLCTTVDALIVETSGVADPLPVAEALASCGVRLDCVVVVVDVESLHASLLESDTARQQLRTADLVLLNKVDLASLGAVADAEDAVSRLTRARTLRCRHGCVPLSAILDVQAVASSPSTPGGSGFISHESASSQGILQLAPATEARGGLGVRQRREEEGGEVGVAARHVFELMRVTSITWRSAEAPLCAAALTAWLLQAALPARGLLRAKGHVWLAQRRRRRCVLQLSGARRTVLLDEGEWEGEPGTELVLIGTDRAALLALCDGLRTIQTATEGGVAETTAFAARLSADTRFKVSCDGGLAEFGLHGAPQHGVDGASLNERLMRSVNSSSLLLLWGVATLQPDRQKLLRAALAPGANAEALAGLVIAHAETLLRSALAHVCTCDC